MFSKDEEDKLIPKECDQNQYRKKYKDSKNCNDGYDSQDDLEQLVRVSVKTPSQSNISNEESMQGNSTTNFQLHNQISAKLKFEKIVDKSSLNFIRFLNCLSIIFLLVTFFTTSISKMNSNNYDVIMEYLIKEKLQAESNLLVLYIAFFFVTLSLIIALLRNLILIKEQDFSHIDIYTILSLHFKHYYYLGNMLFSLCLISNHTKILEKYGFNLIVCILTLIVYLKAYYSHKLRMHNVQLNNWFNYVSFSVNISFLLAWNVCYLTISLGLFISFFKFDPHSLLIINLGSQTFLCTFVVLSISYFHDLYFSFIVLIFQIGNTLNKNLFNSTSNIKGKDESHISIVLTSFTILCFLFGLFYIPKISGKNYKEELEQLHKNYSIDKDTSVKL